MIVERDNPDRVDWDNAIREIGGSWLQSSGWAELQRQRYGRRVERVRVDGPSGTGMAQILFHHLGPVSIAYVPRGPIFSGDAAAVAPLLYAAIDEVCARHRAPAVLLEPPAPLPGAAKGAGRLSPASAARRWHHERTVKVPLLDDDALLAQMRQTTRYEVRLGRRRGIRVDRAGGDQAAVASFCTLLQDTARRNAFEADPCWYFEECLHIFGDDAMLLIAQVDGAVAAGALIVTFGQEAVYWAGASSSKYRVPGAAAYLQFEAMRWARERGCLRYDLWGIPSTDPPPVEGGSAGSRGNNRQGFYHFKTGFGGEIVTYPNIMERRYQPLQASLIDTWAHRQLFAERLRRAAPSLLSRKANDSSDGVAKSRGV